MLTDAEFRVLCALLDRSTRLENSFPSLSTIKEELGGPLRRVQQISNLVTSLARKGFIVKVDLRDKGIIETNNRGRFMATTGFRFMLPPGVLTPTADAWPGPENWSNRIRKKAP